MKVLVKRRAGVNSEGAYVQSALETGYERFGGVIDETYFNSCGLKTSSRGSNGDPHVHHRFISWEEGIEDMLEDLYMSII